jgi:hypothetical protein
MKNMVLVLITGLVFFGCNKNTVQDAGKVEEPLIELHQIEVRGFGYSVNPVLRNAELSARTYAISSIASQIKGVEFSYRQRGNNVDFSTVTRNVDTSGVLTHSTRQFKDDDGNFHYFVVLKSDTDIEIPVGDTIYTKDVALRVEARRLHISLDQGVKNILTDLINEKFPSKTEVTGKIYISDFNIILDKDIAEVNCTYSIVFD